VLAAADPAVCDEVVAGDDQVDRRYLDVDLHLERIADMAVTVVSSPSSRAHFLPSPPCLDTFRRWRSYALDLDGTSGGQWDYGR
jgi:hypothetical protein